MITKTIISILLSFSLLFPMGRQNVEKEQEIILSPATNSDIIIEVPEETSIIEEEIEIDKTQLTNEERYALDLTIPEPFTEDDLRMLTTMVFNENGLVTNEVLVVNEENPEGIYMPADVMHEWTAQVCLNHLKDDRFPDTIYENFKYPTYSSEYRSKELAEKCEKNYPEQWARVKQSCLLAMNGYVDLPPNVIYESNYEDLGTHFAAVYVDTGYFHSWSYFSYG